MEHTSRTRLFLRLLAILCMCGLCLASCQAFRKNAAEPAATDQQSESVSDAGENPQKDEAGKAEAPAAENPESSKNDEVEKSADADAPGSAIKKENSTAKTGKKNTEAQPAAESEKPENSVPVEGQSAVAPSANATMPASSSDETAPSAGGGMSQAQLEMLEPQQRTAFISLLKATNRKKNLYVPALNEQEQAAIGPYAAHYDFLRSLGGQDALLTKFISAEELESKLMSEPENKETYGYLLEESRRVRRLQTELANYYRNSANEKDKLKQPYKLRPVYDEAFNKKILQPITGLLKITPYIEEELRRVAYAFLAYSNNPHNPKASAVLKEFLGRYKEVAEEGNSIIREVKGEE